MEAYSNDRPSKRGSCLHKAVAKGSAEELKSLLDSGLVDVDAVDRQGRTPLMCALWRCFVPGVNMLLENGANVNTKDEEENTPLHFLLWWSCWYKIKDLARGFREFGVNFETLNWSDTHCIDYREVVLQSLAEALVIRGADIESKNKKGEVPLHYAAMSGYFSICKLLLDRGANVNVRDRVNASTPILIAIMNNNEKACELILAKGADVNIKDGRGNSPLYWAIKLHSMKVVSFLLEKGADVESKNEYGETPLISSIVFGFDAGCCLLLDKGADINVKDRDGKSALLLSVERYKFQNCSEVVEKFVKSGCDVNTTNDRGCSLLHIATEKCNEDLVKTLLRNKIDLEHTNLKGETALHWAATYWICLPTVAKLLLEAGANVNAKDHEGRTALHVAAERLTYYYQEARMHLLQLLVDWGGSLLAKDNRDTTPLDMVKVKDSLYEHFIHEHIVKLSCAKLFLLLEVNCDINMLDYYGLQKSYLEEIDRLKTYKCGRNFLIDVFNMYGDPAFISNDILEKTVKSSNLESKFPNYASLLRGTFSKARKRYILLSKAQYCFGDLLPVEIIRKILYYVSDTDLENIINSK